MKPLYTIGHSTRSIEEFLAILRAHGIQHVADVRQFPMSRHVPWFNEDQLRPTLHKSGIGYSHHALLGGRRKAAKDSPNAGWKNASFRGYADYMATPDFAKGLKQLDALIETKRVAIMCAEAVPWRCHRNLISDAEVAQGRAVLHILAAAPPKPHALTPFAVPERRARRLVVRYPPSQSKSPMRSELLFGINL